MADLTFFVKSPFSEVSHSHSVSYTDIKWYILTQPDNMPRSHALLNDWGFSFTTINDGFLIFVTVLTFPGLFQWLFLSWGQLIQEEMTCQKKKEQKEQNYCGVWEKCSWVEKIHLHLWLDVFVYVIKGRCVKSETQTGCVNGWLSPSKMNHPVKVEVNG